MVLGGIAGALTEESTRLFGLPLLPGYDLIGDLFINALKMVVVPLITTAIISGMVNVGDGDDLGRLGLKTVLFYLSTSLIAVLVGLVVVNLIAPGVIDGQPAHRPGPGQHRGPRRRRLHRNTAPVAAAQPVPGRRRNPDAGADRVLAVLRLLPAHPARRAR